VLYNVLSLITLKRLDVVRV